MRIFLIILFISFISLLVFYIFVSIRINALTKRNKEKILNSLSEKEKDIIRNYIDACHVTFKDIFSKRKDK